MHTFAVSLAQRPASLAIGILLVRHRPILSPAEDGKYMPNQVMGCTDPRQLSESGTIGSETSEYTTESRRHGQPRKHKIMPRTTGRLQKATKAPRSHATIDQNRIEANWACKLLGSLPASLKPRPRSTTGKRVGQDQQDRKRLQPDQWTKSLLHALAGLSRVTPQDKSFAHKELLAHVKNRQNKGHHQEHYAREVLTSDIDTVTQEIKRLIAVGRYASRRNSLARTHPVAHEEVEGERRGTWEGC